MSRLGNYLSPEPIFQSRVVGVLAVTHGVPKGVATGTSSRLRPDKGGGSFIDASTTIAKIQLFPFSF
jgi:hypothetical protein